MYRIAYIDESEADRHNFQDYVKYAPSAKDFDLHVMEPKPNFEEFAQTLVNNAFQAIIIDFYLSEKNRLIHYSGTDLAEEILSIRDALPIFILTSFENDAILQSDDVNWVYDKKSIVHKEDPVFLERVKQQIRKFEQKQQKAETRILELLEISKARTLNVTEENELIELDTFIEKSLNKKMPIPNKFKSMSNETRLDKIIDLLERFDTTIQKINQKK